MKYLISTMCCFVFALSGCNKSNTSSPPDTIYKSGTFNFDPRDVKTFAIKFGGVCVVLKNNQAGCVGLRTFTISDRGVEIKKISGFEDNLCLLYQDGKVVCVDTEDSFSKEVAQVPKNLDSAIDISVGTLGACTINSEDKLNCWGTEYIAPSGGDALTKIPTSVKQVGLVSHGWSNTCVNELEEGIICWGGAKVYPFPSDKNNLAVRELSVGNGYNCAIDSSGKVTCWGKPEIVLQMGMPPSGNYKSISVSNSFACGILQSTFKVVCWGTDPYSKGYLNVPMLSGSISDVKTQSDTACALDENLGLRCWGETLHLPAFLKN